MVLARELDTLTQCTAQPAVHQQRQPLSTAAAPSVADRCIAVGDVLFQFWEDQSAAGLSRAARQLAQLSRWQWHRGRHSRACGRHGCKWAGACLAGEREVFGDGWC